MNTIKFNKVGEKRTRVLLEDCLGQNARLKGIGFTSTWLDIFDGCYKIKKGFEWNGCSYARDSQETEQASCIHDALYRTPNYPVSRAIADLIFFDELRRAKFRFLGIIPASHYIYYWGVRIGGGFRYGKR